jgi:hypothetical protein
VFGELDIAAFEHEVGQYFAQSSDDGVHFKLGAKRGKVKEKKKEASHAN